MKNEYVFRTSDNTLLGRVITDEEFESMTADELREALAYTGYSVVIVRSENGFSAYDMRDASELHASEWADSFHNIEAETEEEAIAKLKAEMAEEEAEPAAG
jgi:hypothetical protein